jgi:hypothetical protein
MWRSLLRIVPIVIVDEAICTPFMELAMTFLPLAELQRRRAEGTSPKGGTAGDFSELSGSLTLAPNQKLDALLNLQWDHPMDESVMAAVRAIAGEHSRATILTAAEFVRERERGTIPRALAVSAYDSLVAGINPK